MDRQRRELDEGRQTRKFTAHQERLNRVRALVGVDDLHVGEVAGDVVFDEETIAAEDVAGLGADELSLDPPRNGEFCPVGMFN